MGFYQAMRLFLVWANLIIWAIMTICDSAPHPGWLALSISFYALYKIGEMEKK